MACGSPSGRSRRRPHDAGARVFVDAYQAYGVDPVDVSDLDCDYLVTGCLKYALGLPGLAFLYVRPGLVDEVPPSLTGWFGRVDPFGFDPRSIDFPTHARRFESGTPSVPSAYGAVAGLELLAQLDAEDVRRHVAGLTGHLRSELVAMGEIVRLPESDARRGPQIALWDAEPNRLDAFLRERRIAGSPRGDVVRLSFPPLQHRVRHRGTAPGSPRLPGELTEGAACLQHEAPARPGPHSPAPASAGT